MVDGVTIVGTANLANEVARDASQMYASNLFNLVEDTWDTEAKTFVLDMENDILPGCVITHGGAAVHPTIKNLMEGKLDGCFISSIYFDALGLLGFELINKVPALHTPLMSGANAISGITVVGAVALAGSGNEDLAQWLGAGAVALASVNVVGGYMVTDRMLGFFKKGGLSMNIDLMIQLGYVIAAGLFIFGLKMLGPPDTARKGNGVSAVGMLVAIVAALLDQGIVQYEYILGGMIVGGAVGAVAARTVAMTSMPEMVALFNGVGGVASGLVGVAALSIADGSFTYVTIILSILIGGVTFTGSLVAYGKLSETIGMVLSPLGKSLLTA